MAEEFGQEFRAADNNGAPFSLNSYQVKLLYAHSANDLGERQILVDHLRNVANLARDLAEPFDGGDLAFLAGLWHDAGKADPNWQRRLQECEMGQRDRIGLDHKCAGALLAEEASEVGWLIGLLIHAHHGGLGHPNEDFKPWLDQNRSLPGPANATKALRAAMPDLTGHQVPTYPKFIKGRRDAEFFLRLTYSALVDADSLDTEAHKLGGRADTRGDAVTLENLWCRYEAFMSKSSPVPESSVNQVRREVHEACLRAADEPRGIFRLTVPTGGGKTRSAMAFALRHGMKHGLRRVVVAVPFTTITQQTARVYRDIFEDGYPDDGRIVLEHHSAAIERAGRADGDDERFNPASVWERLATENWAAPVIVTTTVQLFESLFSNRRSKTRKLHNLAGSVVILDEAQALPPSMLSPILDGLRQLSEGYGASVVLSTATQPAFELIKEFREVEAREIVRQPARNFELLKRVDFEWRTDGPNEWPKVAAWMGGEQSALAIVNTKRHALELLDALNDPDCLHLSTLLCGAHRGEVLKEIGRRLAAGEPCRVVSTQVVEAGVDLDFATVFRAEAPLDAVIQAAGRCNREGRRERGRVVVFRSADDASPPGVYRIGRDTARAVLQLYKDSDPDKLHVLRAYFERIAERVNADEHGIQSLRENLDFPEVADRFRMIKDESYDVIVNYPNAEGTVHEDLLEHLRGRRRPAREVLRLIQPFIVSLRQDEAEHLKTQGRIEELMPCVGLWHGAYDTVRGIVETDPELVV